MAKSPFPPPLFLALVLFLTITPSNSQQPTINPADLSALRQIKDSLTDIPSSAAVATFFSSWNFSAPSPCSSFSGVTCSPSGRVTALSLGTGLSSSLGLAGTLSPAISRLSDLSQLILYAGIVTGPIPRQLSSLRALRVLSLTNNRLTGSIPAAIFSLPNLHTLDLSRNRLSGRVPASIHNLSLLKVLILSSNRLWGGVPGPLPEQLLHLDLSENLFSGTLPPRMPAGLRYLSVAKNRMWGGIEALGNGPTELSYADLSENKFGGPIPGSLLFAPSVNSMLLQRNNFTGEVPKVSLSSPPRAWQAGSTVDLSHNFLTGELSPDLAGVETLFLNYNMLTGAVPAEYVESVRRGDMKTLYLQHNYITGFPLDAGAALPDTAAVCVSYNCMAAPPVGMAACPASAGNQISRPAYQCAAFRNSSSSDDYLG